MTYIDISAVTNGVSPDYSFYLVSIVNASSLLGRVVSGILVDKTGKLASVCGLTPIGH